MKAKGYSTTIANAERKPPRNEDTVIVDDDLELYIVCDGMGGHAAGDIASQLASKTVHDFVLQHHDDFITLSDKPAYSQDLIELVRTAVQTACARVFDRASTNSDQRGMGCTLTMVLVLGKTAVMAHVGDSRLYLIRRGVAHQLSHDHTVIQELLDRGAMDIKAGNASPYAHVLSRAVGAHETVQVDTLRFDILPDDILLLCSDGFTDAYDEPEEIEALVRVDNPKVVGEQLVCAARKRGSSDDISVLIIDIQGSPEDYERERLHADEAILKLETLKQVYMFQGLRLQDLARLVDRCFVVLCSKGEIVFREGETGNKMCIILEGKLEVTKNGKRLAELGEGNHAGEMALLCDTPRSASVIALEKSKLLLLSRTDFMAIIQEEPFTGSKLLLTLAQELSMRLYAMNELNV